MNLKDQREFLEIKRVIFKMKNSEVEQKVCTVTSLKKVDVRPRSTCKDTQHALSAGKCKGKAQ